MSEIKMLNLFRCGLAEDACEDIRKDELANYFAVDYFDMIHVEDMDQKTAALSDCMGIQQKANNKKGVSHQRYCLYSSEQGLSDIFGKEESYPVLMVIQLFINPNIYQATSFSDGEVFSGDNWIKKLNALIKKQSIASKVKWKIYQLLTAGDLAVVVRCEKVHTAYDICTLIRSVRFGVEGKEIEESVFYSYSVCGVLDTVDQQTQKVAEVCWQNCLDANDQVIVRIKYTQSFRKKLQKNPDLKDRLLAEGAHLIGRYDHQLSFSREEFQQLYPYIRQYKLEGKKIYIENTENLKSPKVRMLLEMMNEQYISYMNERLLLHYEQDLFLKGTEAETWMLLCEKEWNSLYNVNYQKIVRVKEKILKLEKQMRPYYQSARNLKEYLRLAGRLCRVLNEINKLPELRISTSNILTQYETMIDSFAYYVNNISGDRKKDHADTIEENLRYGIRALEIFIRYIRNVNLQTFQTPNYDLQTNVCIEKVLLAYSQFLKPLVDRRTMPYELPVRLQPMIVPSMGERDLSVVVPFHYCKRGDNREHVQRLMVVYSPTFSFLCETCFQVPAVFHEIAHQFRYESRRERNGCLERYILKTFLHLPILRILNMYEMYDLATVSFIEEIVNVVYDEVFVNLVKDEDRDACLQSFCRKMSEELKSFFEYVFEVVRFIEKEDENDLEKEVKNYLSKTKCSIQKYDEPILNKIEKIDESVDEIKKREKIIVDKKQRDLQPAAIKERLDLQKELKTAVRNLKILQEQQICGAVIEKLYAAGESELAEDYKILWKQLHDDHRNSIEIGIEAFEKWNISQKKWKGKAFDQEQITGLLRQYHGINSAYKNFDVRVPEDLSKDTLKGQLRYQKLYDDLCKILSEELPARLKQYAERQKNMLDWNTESLSNEYLSCLAKNIRLNGKKGMRRILSDIFEKESREGIENYVTKKTNFYREVTSDLFMCAMMDLDGFGYLVVAAEIFKFNSENQEIQIQRVSLVLQCLCAVASKNKNLEAEIFWEELLSRMRQETKVLHEGLCKESKAGRIEGESLKTCPENAEFKTIEEIRQFLDACVNEEGLTSTQGWIIRIYRQVAAIIHNITGYHVSRTIIGMKEVWEDVIQEKAYYAQKESLRELLQKAGGARLCESITEILNSPAKYFVEKKSILHEEVDFILSQYEESCKNIF